MTGQAKLIVFEGIDGSGKTTISRRLATELGKTIPIVWLREPGDSRWGKEIRRLAHQHSEVSPRRQLELFMKDRRENVRLRILPALQSGHSVILDRYFYSTACYQGARGLEMEKILEENRRFAPEADLVILVDLDVDTALERIQAGRPESAPLFETRDFLQKVRSNYLSLKGNHIHVVDGGRDAESVYREVEVLVARELAELKGEEVKDF
ncbi:MAG: dTMP kinase [Acidobacteriota bacterium]|jgi:dTMP kinase|nr:dTMP kinase [Acidobacteriota bacterium]